MSEGAESKRELAFELKNEILTEGYGNLNAEGTAFADKNSIKYTFNMPLKKTACK